MSLLQFSFVTTSIYIKVGMHHNNSLVSKVCFILYSFRELPSMSSAFFPLICDFAAHVSESNHDCRLLQTWPLLRCMCDILFAKALSRVDTQLASQLHFERDGACVTPCKLNIRSNVCWNAGPLSPLAAKQWSSVAEGVEDRWRPYDRQRHF